MKRGMGNKKILHNISIYTGESDLLFCGIICIKYAQEIVFTVLTYQIEIAD